MNARALARRLLGDARLGALSFRKNPETRHSWGGPMNGQGWRCRLVAELMLRLDLQAVVETGTFRGTTTEWLAAFQLPIFTCELSAEHFGFARARLSNIPNVHLLHMDSRPALRHLLNGPLGRYLDQDILFYLDAHWNNDLPLVEEIDLIFGKAKNAIVLVDDFQVPGDDGYSYDDYGGQKALTREYIDESVRKHNLAAFGPITPSRRETGEKRGCIVLARELTRGPVLEQMTLLRRLY